MPRRALQHARILITGASSGLGRELSLQLARRGARLLLTARREELLAEVADACRALGAEVSQVAGDVAESACRAALVDACRRNWNGLDVLVNNAGTSAHGRFDQSDAETLRRIMEVNFFAVVELTRACLPLMRQAPQRAGASPPPAPPAILNIGSLLGHRGAPFNGEYSASKFALRGWSEALRAELRGDVDVLLASPGTLSTDFFRHLIAKRGELPWGRARGIPAATAARQIVRQLERGKREIFPNWRGRALVLANRACPGLVDRAMARFGRTREN